ncbi:TetR/AcrR family transcriptional regulator [Streptomyces europaeiscabiei]|uniref:TetR/AcrR family transcriptional regulator n=1 Tax=Streptomyces europaeiscabiei TaxID=146819 RepID=UPI002E10BB0B|nr:TetR/AcrR family transcriptional regulator [Streptomyces europaeiscabiei]
MPRHVDHEQRRRDIIDASRRILVGGGPSALTIRAVAKELGGSITLVTHFFPTRPELMRAVVAEMIDSYDTELAALEEGADAPTRLRILMRWMLPLAEDEWGAEKGRIVLIAQRDQEPSIGEFFTTMDARIRGLLRSHVEPLVPAERVDATVDLLRVLANGLVLSAVEHHHMWPPERQLAVLDAALAAYGL